ncbi:toxin-antitoxin system protein [Prevotella melaninogenica]
MKLYRVDKRLYDVGNEILPNTDYFQALNNEIKGVLEKKLDEKRCIVKARKECLFLFNSLYHALIFFSKYGGYIYEVAPEEVFFRGDMNKLDNILDALRFCGEDGIDSFVNEYWKDGTHTFSPCYEVLCKKAIVIKCIELEITKEDFYRELKNAGNCVEQTRTYHKLFNEQYQV